MKGRRQQCGVCALLVVCLWAGPAFATKIVIHPHPAFLLRGLDKLIAQDSDGSAILYDAKTGQASFRFAVKRRIAQIALTRDERFLLFACGDGTLALWDVTTGEQVWQKGPSETGLESVYDIAFAHDGRSFVVCHRGGLARTYGASTGKMIRKVGSVLAGASVGSAALSPDGSTGALLEWRPGDDSTERSRLLTFDAASGALKDTGVAGSWGAQYSADGKYIACVNSTSDGPERLRVIAANGPPAPKDVGAFRRIGNIKPSEDGRFLVTAILDGPKADTVAGLSYAPAAEKLEELWRLPPGPGSQSYTGQAAVKARASMRFRAEALLSVWTDYKFVTRLVDLKTGEALLTIDNSANYREPPSLLWDIMQVPLVVVAFLGVVALFVVFVRWRCRVG